MFIVDVLEHVGRVSSRWSSLREAMETRARRYAAVQERLVGHQPHLAEPYISTGSLYLCTVAFLPLGLPASDRFWADPPAEWTSRRTWSGADLAADHALAE